MTDKQWEKIMYEVRNAAYDVERLPMALHNATYGKTLKIRNEARQYAIRIAKRNGWRAQQ